MPTLTPHRRALIAGAGASLLAASLARADEAALFPLVETADGLLRGLVWRD